MSTSRFVLVNLAATIGTIKNGTGGGAPALDEETPYAMSRLLIPDRLAFWRSSASPGTAGVLNIDVDLGAATTIGFAGLLGYRAATTDALTDVIVTADSVYPIVSTTSRAAFSFAGAPATAASGPYAPRDAGGVLSSPLSRRYWRFELSVADQFQVGTLVLGVVTDVGAVHSPNAVMSPYRFRSQQPLVGGGVWIDDLGDRGADYTLPFNVADLTRTNLLASLADLPGSFVFLDHQDAVAEVVLANSARVDIQRAFALGANSIHQVNVTLTRLP